jgi:hypothetical protein
MLNRSRFILRQPGPVLLAPSWSALTSSRTGENGANLRAQAIADEKGAHHIEAKLKKRIFNKSYRQLYKRSKQGGRLTRRHSVMLNICRAKEILQSTQLNQNVRKSSDIDARLFGIVHQLTSEREYRVESVLKCGCISVGNLIDVARAERSMRGYTARDC